MHDVCVHIQVYAHLENEETFWLVFLQFVREADTVVWCKLLMRNLTTQ